MASVIKNFDAGSLRTYLKGLSRSNMSTVFRALDDIDYSSIVRKLDSETLQLVARNLDDDVIVRVLKNIDDDLVKTLAKNLDDVQMARLFKLDPDLAPRLGSGLNDDVLSAAFTRNGMNATDAQAAVFKTRQAQVAVAKVPGPRGTALADRRAVDAATTPATKKASLTKSIDELGEAGTDVSQKLADKTGLAKNNVDDAVEASADLAEAVPDIKEAARKLGMLPADMFIEGATVLRKHWMKIGAGMVLLCMMYDTNNPFTALDRALEDVDDAVDGLKDIADSAAGAAAAAASGGFDLITFLTQNWWLSALCCVAVIIIAMVSALGLK